MDDKKILAKYAVKKPEYWGDWSLERQIGYNQAIYDVFKGLTN